MNYINQTGTLMSIDAVRALYPNMSIPEGADLEDIGFAKVFPAINPPVPGLGQMLVMAPPQQVDGVWYEVFTLADAPTPEIPQVITRAQGKIALIMSGRWEAVLAYVAAIEDPTDKAMAEVALHDTLNWERNSPSVQATAAALNLSSADLDELFINAAKVAL